MIPIVFWILLDNKVNENGVGQTCSTYARKDKCMRNFWPDDKKEIRPTGLPPPRW